MGMNADNTIDRNFRTQYCEVQLTTETVTIRDIEGDRLLVHYEREEWADNPFVLRDVLLAMTDINALRGYYPPRDENGDPLPVELLPFEDTEAYPTLNVLQEQRESNGAKRYTLEFLDEEQRAIAHHRLRLYEKRLRTLSEIGHELIQNGKSCTKYSDDLGRIRMEVGAIVLDWAQAMAMEEKSFSMKLEIKRLLKRTGASEDLIEELEAKWRDANDGLD